MGTGVVRLNALYSDNVPLAVVRERCGATGGGDEQPRESAALLHENTPIVTNGLLRCAMWRKEPILCHCTYIDAITINLETFLSQQNGKKTGMKNAS
jgi:hypothetical protein